jgi:hypothetical protein
MAVPKTAALPLGYTPTTAFYLKNTNILQICENLNQASACIFQKFYSFHQF